MVQSQQCCCLLPKDLLPKDTCRAASQAHLPQLISLSSVQKHGICAGKTASKKEQGSQALLHMASHNRLWRCTPWQHAGPHNIWPGRHCPGLLDNAF